MQKRDCFIIGINFLIIYIILICIIINFATNNNNARTIKNAAFGETRQNLPANFMSKINIIPDDLNEKINKYETMHEVWKSDMKLTTRQIQEIEQNIKDLKKKVGI